MNVSKVNAALKAQIKIEEKIKKQKINFLQKISNELYITPEKFLKRFKIPKGLINKIRINGGLNFSEIHIEFSIYNYTDNVEILCTINLDGNKFQVSKLLKNK